jgi:hypothetical protein
MRPRLGPATVECQLLNDVRNICRRRGAARIFHGLLPEARVSVFLLSCGGETKSATRKPKLEGNPNIEIRNPKRRSLARGLKHSDHDKARCGGGNLAAGAAGSDEFRRPW